MKSRTIQQVDSDILALDPRWQRLHAIECRLLDEHADENGMITDPEAKAAMAAVVEQTKALAKRFNALMDEREALLQAA